MLLLMTQHRVTGLAFVALAVVLAAGPGQPGARMAAVPLLTPLLGGELLVYTEGNTLFAMREMEGMAPPEGGRGPGSRSSMK